METAARPAHPSDVDVLGALVLEFEEEMAEEKGGDVWLRRHRRPEPFADSLLTDMGRSDRALFVGTIDEVVVGYGVVEHSLDPLTAAPSGHTGTGGGSSERAQDSLGIVSELFVTREARGVGIGREILDALVAWCDARGCSGVDAVALPGARETKNFFEAAHFTARALVVHHRLREGPARADGVRSALDLAADRAAVQAP